MSFASDNTAGVSPAILAAIAAVNQGVAPAYGADAVTTRLGGVFSSLFEKEVAVFPVATGTACNVLALSLLTPPYGAIFCHAEAHIAVDECGAPEFFTGGAKLIGLPGAGGKITPQTLDTAIAASGIGVQHHAQAAAVSLSQATEAGTVYTLSEIKALADLAHHHGLKLHMDGARFANALVAQGCSPAEASWKAGIDVLSFGATKNGAMAAEAVIVFDPALAASMRYRRKRGGHLFSKMRFLSAQLEAYLADGLWLANARHANAMAARLAEGLAALPGARLIHAVEANEVFADLPDPVIEGLLAEGFAFHRWGSPTPTTIRLVTAFDTAPERVDGFLASARRRAAALPKSRN
ncbi:MAG: low specificity L-threonine aldolase [Alphaproteobacteria bacterium]|nr:low specificity L-threonine aldolase [Alphaproteobacteria bacterium]